MTHEEAVSTLAAERYLLNEMTDQDRQTFEEHFFDCEVCADDMRSVAAMLQAVATTTASTTTAAPTTTATDATKPSGRVVPLIPKPPSNRPVWYRAAALPWAAAATLAVVTAYQAFVVVPPLRRGSVPTALTPVTVRPASRGADAIVPLGSDDSPVTLALELAEAPESPELTYTLRRADGAHVAEGRVAAPPAGTPLLFLMPSSTLVGSMHYILTVHDAGSPNRTLGEYRFEVSKTS
jgi:anti-sigma factor RsiW